ncbi:Endocytosis and vacuole integrity protein [Homalodisca vitripennis]|nr:Endocytosis and vacuole integrity protein [Homalodisca vitripennis]
MRVPPVISAGFGSTRADVNERKTSLEIVPIRSENDSSLREELAKMCFETLLQFSLLEGLEGEEELGEEGLAGRLAVTALLHRFQQVLHQYVQDEARSGKCPLPRLVSGLEGEREKERQTSLAGVHKPGPQSSHHMYVPFTSLAHQWQTKFY